MCFSRESILRDISLKLCSFSLLFSCLLLLLSESISAPSDWYFVVVAVLAVVVSSVFCVPSRASFCQFFLRVQLI